MSTEDTSKKNNKKRDAKSLSELAEKIRLKMMEKKESKGQSIKKMNELHDKLALNYRYFRRNNSSEVPKTDRIISVGWKIVLDVATDTTSIQYAVALCGKHESFSRKMAQSVIDDRFDKGFVNSFNIDLKDFPEKTVNALVRIHYNSGKNDANTLGMKKLPNWARFIP